MIYYKNYDQIVKKITDGYEFGNVYDYRTNTEIKATISSFDDVSYNFHILYEVEFYVHFLWTVKENEPKEICSDDKKYFKKERRN